MLKIIKSLDDAMDVAFDIADNMKPGDEREVAGLRLQKWNDGTIIVDNKAMHLFPAALGARVLYPRRKAVNRWIAQEHARQVRADRQMQQEVEIEWTTEAKGNSG